MKTKLSCLCFLLTEKEIYMTAKRTSKSVQRTTEDFINSNFLCLQTNRLDNRDCVMIKMFMKQMSAKRHVNNYNCNWVTVIVTVATKQIIFRAFIHSQISANCKLLLVARFLLFFCRVRTIKTVRFTFFKLLKFLLIYFRGQMCLNLLWWLDNDSS